MVVDMTICDSGNKRRLKYTKLRKQTTSMRRGIYLHHSAKGAASLLDQLLDVEVHVGAAVSTRDAVKGPQTAI